MIQKMRNKSISILFVFIPFVFIFLLPIDNDRELETYSILIIDNGIELEIDNTIAFGEHEWRILEIQDGMALVISENIITHRAYHDSEHIDRQKRQLETTWERSMIRYWLNDELLNSFTISDKARIVEKRVVNNHNAWFGTSGGNDTYDRIFLLSLEEAVQYFGDSGQLLNRPDRWWINDEYNTARMARDSYGNLSWWWLRCTGDYSIYAARVNADGGIHLHGTIVNDSTGGIRPALWLNLEY